MSFDRLETPSENLRGLITVKKVLRRVHGKLRSKVVESEETTINLFATTDNKHCIFAFSFVFRE